MHKTKTYLQTPQTSGRGNQKSKMLTYLLALKRVRSSDPTTTDKHVKLTEGCIYKVRFCISVANKGVWKSGATFSVQDALKYIKPIG